MASLLPFFFNLTDRPILLVGGGLIALEKLEKLMIAGAAVTLIAPKVRPEIYDLQRQNRQHLNIIERSFRKRDPKRFAFVITATNDRRTNRLITQASHRLGKLVNAVDDPPHCDFFFAAQFDQGPIQVAISSSGQLPGLVKAIRETLTTLIPVEHNDLVEELCILRNSLRTVYPSTKERGEVFRKLLKQWRQDYLLSNRLKQIKEIS